jgi:hypothetical protein
MKLAPHGEYKIEAHGNILVVDAHGPFTDEITKQYVQDMYTACEEFTGQVWGLLVTFYGSGIFTPDAEAALIEVTKFRVKHGMIANASVILNSSSGDLQQMQLRRIYQTCNLTFHVFSNIDAAKSWLSEFITEKSVVM